MNTVTSSTSPATFTVPSDSVSSSTRKLYPKCVGILREFSSAWERRVALTPVDCAALINKGVHVIVQPSKIRCYGDSEYAEVGAEISDDLSACTTILGIQEPNPKSLLPDKTYFFFSYIKKGKTDNPFLLDKVLENRIRLIDYECITEDIPDKTIAKRLVSFGRIAGVAGCINLLKGIGELLLARQVATPFVFCKVSYMYSDIEDAKLSLQTLGRYIEQQFLPECYSPFIIGVLGNGQVSAGVQEALKCLPSVFLTPKQLLQNQFDKRRDRIYVVVFNLEDLFEKIDSESATESEAKFDKADFISCPESYHCVFNTRYLSFLHGLVNCLYWENRYPKIFTKSQLKHHVSKHDCRLIGISDISCDIDGSIDILHEYSNYRKPFFIYEPVIQKYIHDVDNTTREGIIYHAIPNLATSFPVDASNHFSSVLIPYLHNAVDSSYPVAGQELCNELTAACISKHGVLSPLYRNIFKYSEQADKSHCSFSKKVYQYPFFLNIKIKGHLFDTGFFNWLICLFPDFKLKPKVNFLTIGESDESQSICYFDLFSDTKDSLKDFYSLVQQKNADYKMEINILKHNVN